MQFLLPLSLIPIEIQKDLYLILKEKFERDPYLDNPPITGDELLNKKLEEIGDLHIHVYNMLKSAQIRTIGQLANTSRKELQKLRGFGNWSLNQVEEYLMVRGLFLKN
jgi:DNA-directed RNA polymerase subunit alpha